MGKVARAGLGLGITAAGIASGAGWFTGAFYKQLGIYAIGSLLQSKLSHSEGPRLEDLGVQLAAEGADLPRGWGRWRQAGNIVWCPGLDEHREGSNGGKGGPSQTEYKYTASAYVVGGWGQLTQMERIRMNERVAYNWNGGNEQGFKLLKQGNTATGAWKWVKDGDGKVRVYPGTLNQPVDTWLESIKGVGQWTAYPNLWGAFFENISLDDYGGRLPNITFDVYNAQTDLAEVVREICFLRGLIDDDLDLHELVGTSIAQTPNEGYVLASRRAAADAIAELGYLFNFTLRECNGVLQAIRRGRAPVMFVSARDATVGTGDESTPPLEEKWGDVNELPLTETLTFGDAGRESNPGVRRATRSDAPDPAPVGARGGRTEGRTITAQLSGGRALRAVQIRLGERWAARETYPLSLSHRFLRLAAGDEMVLEIKGEKRRLVIPGITQPHFGPLVGTGVGTNPRLYTMPVPGSGGYEIESPLPDSPETPIGFGLECVAISSDRPDTASKAGFLFAATQIAARSWRGAEANVEFENSPGVWKKDYDVTINSKATMGYLRVPWTPQAKEQGTTGSPIPAKLYHGELHTASGSAPAKANTLVFETGLVVRFGSVVQNGSDPLSLDLHDVLCGVWGSDYPEAGMEAPNAGGARSGLQLAANTKFLLLYDEEGDRMPGWDFTVVGNGLIGQSRRITLVPHNVADALKHAVSFEFSPVVGRNVEPLSPLATATRTEDGGLRVQGHGRTRFVESNTDNPTRFSERPTAQGFKYRITLASGSGSGTVEKFSSAPVAAFDFVLTAGEIAALVGRSLASVMAETLSGDIALWSDDTGYGRKTVWSLVADTTSLRDENNAPILDENGEPIEGEPQN